MDNEWKEIIIWLVLKKVLKDMKIFETVDVLDKCRKITDNPKKKEYWEKKIYEVIGRAVVSNL